MDQGIYCLESIARTFVFPGEPGRDFHSQKYKTMNKAIFGFLILVFGAVQLGKAQDPGIPEWFTEDMEANIGTWIADNSAFKGEQEPFEAYGLEWKWGIGKTSITGRLFALQEGKEIGPFWEFRQYWDNIEKKGIVAQYGGRGSMGSGEIRPLKGGKTELIQTFSLSDGRTWVEKHISEVNETQLTTVNFEKNEKGTWDEKRTYVWKKQPSVAHENAMDPGEFSISLVVKDIQKSYNYYKNLGFEPVESVGSLKDHWILLHNGTTQIGLFQDMFPNNILTFNPTDARSIYKKLVEAGFAMVSVNDIDKPEGPCSFVMVDPDGNMILVDQHE